MQQQLEFVFEDEKLLTTAQVAARLHISVFATIRWLKRGYFPHAYRLDPHTKSAWRIPEEILKTFLELRRKNRGAYYKPPDLVGNL